MNKLFGLPRADLEATSEAARSDLDRLAGSRILITGGTGFLGSWLTASLIQAQLAGVDLDLVVLSRNPDSVPLEQHEHLTIARGDVRTFAPSGGFDVIIHGAANSSARAGTTDASPWSMATTITQGTERLLELGARSKSRFLFLSSGAVYGPQTAPVSEDLLSGPNPLDPKAAYAEAKRYAENVCSIANAAGDVSAVIARLFAFVGPRIPLDAHYAAGNFIDAVRHGRRIEVLGDGRPLRSYLYAGDLAEWCWAILARGATDRAYNVGSPTPISILDLAHQVSALADEYIPVAVLGSTTKGDPPCYVPRIDRATAELGLRPRTSLDEALRRTLRWAARSSSPGGLAAH